MDLILTYWWVWTGILFLILPEVIFKLTGRERYTASVWWWDAFAIRGFLHGINEPEVHYPQKHIFLRRAIGGALWGGITLHFFFMTSFWPIIIYGVPAVWSIFYFYKNER